MINTEQESNKYSNLVDIPLAGDQKDLLGVDRYTSALARFIQRAKTPSTLSIQGEWGSGKTSLMNQLRHKLCRQNQDDIKPYRGIWLNIWKLSLMHSPEQTLEHVIKEITKQIMDILVTEYDYKDESSDLWKKIDFKKAGKTALKSLIKGAINFGATYAGAGPIIGLSKNTEQQEKTITTIPELQSAMETLIEYCWEKDYEINKNARGFLFFIDDLDRLDPSVAVSVLELLKNVFEVEHCVFVLAIDYEVVVRGLVPKFGEFNDKTERQFRSFFDKIIQLPFNMPVQSYDTQSYVTEALINIDYFSRDELEKKTSVTENDYEYILDTDSSDETIEQELSENDNLTVAEAAVELLKLSTGSNPRSMIRLINSLSLNQIMWEGQEKGAFEKITLSSEDKLVNLGFTCMQIAYGAIYTLLNNNPCFLRWDEVFAEQSRLNPLSAQEQKELDLSNEKEPWQIVIRRAVQNNIFMRQRRRNIEKLLRLIAKLAVETSVNNMANDEKMLDALSNKFQDLLSFSAVTDAGVSSVENTAKKTEKKFRPLEDKRYKFWQMFIDYAWNPSLNKNTEIFQKEFSGNRRPSHDAWMDYTIGYPKLCYMSVLQIHSKKLVRITVSIKNKDTFHQLYDVRDEIESDLGYKLEWRELPEKKISSIEFNNEALNPEDESSWQTVIFPWIVENLVNIKTAFVKQLKIISSR